MINRTISADQLRYYLELTDPNGHSESFFYEANKIVEGKLSFWNSVALLESSVGKLDKDFVLDFSNLFMIELPQDIKDMLSRSEK